MNDSFRTPPTSVSLLRRLCACPLDQEAWQEFVERYGKQIYVWCRRWGLQEADAADVTQLVLIKLAQELPRFEYDPARRFRRWLKTIAHHAWRDLVTNRQRLILSRAQGVGLEALEAPDDLASQLDAALDQELLALASARVRLRVQPATWEAFRLTALERLPGEEAARRLGMKLTSVYKAKSNLLKMLQAEIRALEGAEVS